MEGDEQHRDLLEFLTDQQKHLEIKNNKIEQRRKEQLDKEVQEVRAVP